MSSVVHESTSVECYELYYRNEIFKSHFSVGMVAAEYMQFDKVCAFMPQSASIGVYICHCGGNISDTVVVPKVKEAIEKLDGVKVVQNYDYMCSKPGQDMIKKDIKELNSTESL